MTMKTEDAGLELAMFSTQNRSSAFDTDCDEAAFFMQFWERENPICAAGTVFVPIGAYTLLGTSDTVRGTASTGIATVSIGREGISTITQRDQSNLLVSIGACNDSTLASGTPGGVSRNEVLEVA